MKRSWPRLPARAPRAATTSAWRVARRLAVRPAPLPLPVVLLAPVLLLTPVLGRPFAVQAQTTFFEEGNRLYQEGDFAGAAAKYEAVLESGYESPALHYNLGNARYRMGEAAAAVIAYERALRLDPGNDDVRANLALVNQRLRDRIEPLPRFWLLAAFDWWMKLLPRGALAAAAAGCWGVLGLAGVFLVLRRPPGWQIAARRTAWVATVATAALGGTLLAREAGVGQPEEAVVVAPEARVLSAPSAEGGLTVFTLHAGTKVRIDQRSGAWAEVVLADGKVGWLELDALEVI